MGCMDDNLGEAYAAWRTSVQDACLFCHDAPANKMIELSQHWVSVWDGFPARPGHVLIIPRRHVVGLPDLNDAERAEFWTRLDTVYAVIQSEHPHTEGFTVGVNDGRAAGRTVDHLHVHVIPRRPGDADDPRGGIRNMFPDASRPWESA